MGGIIFLGLLVAAIGYGCYYGKIVLPKLKNKWEALIAKHTKFGFTKRIVVFDYMQAEKLDAIGFKDCDNGIFVNYQDKLLKLVEGENSKTIPFQSLYDVRIDSIGVAKTKGLGVGDSIALFGATTSEYVSNITIQIVIKDPSGGVKTEELRLCKAIGNMKRGSSLANSFEKCAAAILDEIIYIIDNC